MIVVFSYTQKGQGAHFSRVNPNTASTFTACRVLIIRRDVLPKRSAEGVIRGQTYLKGSLKGSGMRSCEKLESSLPESPLGYFLSDD
jgi:hypothetical protein